MSHCWNLLSDQGMTAVMSGMALSNDVYVRIGASTVNTSTRSSANVKYLQHVDAEHVYQHNNTLGVNLPTFTYLID